MSVLYPSQSIANQVVLITGASSGIGEACARRFAEAGCKLVLIARRTERLQSLKETLEAQYKVPVFTETLDVRDTEAITSLPARLPTEWSEVDILVNNAGLALGTAPVTELSIEDMHTMLQTNVAGVAVFTRTFAPGMVARNCGHIVNISSVAGHEAYGGGAMYCATKFAVDALTTASRHDLMASSNVRVTAVSPGAVRTEFSNVRFGGDAAKADAVYQGIVPLSGADVADNVLYAVTRPAHVQIGEIIVWATLQASAKGIARVLKD
jgi:NADP-dependent 3-hydroxy acid dehydrogenase YdfG